MKKRYDFFFLLLLGIIIVVFGFSIFIIPQKSFSDKENRRLSTLPRVSLDSIVSGEYFERLGDFYSDQFPLRNSFTSAHAILELSLGKQESNNVMITNNTLITLNGNKDLKNIKQNISLISALDKAHLYVPPSSQDVFDNPSKDLSVSSLLPEETAEDFHELCQYSDEYIYYKTDHHWTTRGAYIAYTQICDKLSLIPYHEEYFTKESVNTDFRGTSFSRSCLPIFSIEADEIILYRYENDEKITVVNNENGESFKGFYQTDHLDTTDKYRVFLGGNYAHISILNENPKPKLLLIKDSFANSLVSFLALHFDIEMIDPRYCSKSLLREQLTRRDVDSILFLVSIDTLSDNVL